MEDNPRILIVEDEPLILALAQSEFEEAGFDVLTASDSAAALEIIESDVPLHVLFTDIRMPGPIDGWALAKLAQSRRPGIRVIYATGFTADEPNLLEGSAFVTKPYLLDQVIEIARGA